MEDIFGNFADIKAGSDKMSRALQVCQAAEPQYFGQVFLSNVRARPSTPNANRSTSLCSALARVRVATNLGVDTQMDYLHKYEEVCVHQQIASEALQEALHQKAFKSFCEVRSSTQQLVSMLHN
jgi:hypothetical protein